MRLVIFGQAPFGADSYTRLRDDGHEIAAVFAPPDGSRGEDPLAVAAAEDDVPVHRFARYRELITNGAGTIPEVMEACKAAEADLFVLAFVTLYVPLDLFGDKEAIVYHPSLLPLHRGASAINHTIIAGDSECGFTIFYADDGLDTGDIVLQRSYPVGPNDTIIKLYADTLYPEGIDGISEAVKAIEAGTADRIVQTERDNMEPPYYDPILTGKPQLIDFTKSVQEVHDLIRGCDSAPGAYFEVDGVQVTLLGSSMLLDHAAATEAAVIPVDKEGEGEVLGTLAIEGNGGGTSAVFTQDAIVVNCTGSPAGRVGESLSLHLPVPVCLVICLTWRCVSANLTLDLS